MSELTSSRRDVLKAAGVGLAGVAGLSGLPAPAAGHESVEASATDLLGPIQVPADRDAGFNYPYYLYVPEATQAEPAPMLVEPNNTGTATNDFEEHRTAARRFSEGRLGWTRTYAEALTVPLLVPVFPRPAGDPVSGNHYPHALDETTMRLDGTDLERIDLQLRSMIEHAQDLLADLSYPVADDVMLNGFSASGNFVNRFTALHPDVVRSVTAGGVNGTLLLPRDRAKGHTLNYHIGVADLEAITGDPFDIETWREVSQFVYLGGEDENDTIPYDDAWNDRQREIALDVYGEDMQEDRMPYCEDVYAEAGADARFEIYEGVGHSQPIQVQRDIVAFHREAGEFKQLSFAGPPAVGDTELAFETSVFGDGDRFDLRVRSDERGDVTGSPATVTVGEPAHATVALTGPVEAGERLSGHVVPAGTTDPDGAVASAEQSATDPPSIRVVGQPTTRGRTVTLEYAVGADYETGSPIHMYAELAGARSKQLLATFAPGTAQTGAYDLDPDELDASLETGAELRVALQDIDRNEEIATDSVALGGDDGDGASGTVAFDAQPTEGHGTVDVAYSLDEAYDPDGAATLQLRIGGADVLLGAVEPGAAATETFSLERIGAAAGDVIEARVVDGGPVARARTVVVGDTDDAVEVGFTERPTEADPTATVRYRVDKDYRIADALTLRAYGDGLPGSVPGNAFALLEPGDDGTATVTVGEDVDPSSDDWTVAVVDDVPLALAAVDDPLVEPLPGAESDDEQATETAAEQTATPTGSEATVTETQTEAPTATATPTGTPAEAPADGDGATTAADGPGFGLASALAGVGGAVSLLKRRFDGDGDER